MQDLECGCGLPVPAQRAGPSQTPYGSGNYFAHPDPRHTTREDGDNATINVKRMLIRCRRGPRDAADGWRGPECGGGTRSGTRPEKCAYFNWSATLSIPACEHTSSLPGVPETPTAPITSSPALIGSPPASASTRVY